MNKPQKLKATCTVNADECIKLKELFNSKSLLAMEKLDIKQATNGFGMTLNGFDVTMNLIEIIPLEKSEIEKVDDMNLENTKVYTTDPEVIRKYSELCGKELSGFDLSMTSTVGVYNCKTDRFVNDFENGSVADNFFTKITPDQINALYAEKFGNNPEIPDSSEWKNGDNCRFGRDMRGGIYVAWDEYNNGHVVYCAGDYHYVMSHELLKPETPQQREERERNEWAQNVICEMMDATGLDFTQDGDVQVVKAMYDLGYRKQKDGD